MGLTTIGAPLSPVSTQQGRRRVVASSTRAANERPCRILHKARRLAGGGSAYDDRIIRARLAQAFGRLIRSKEDSGHFIVLSPAFPSRLLSAFPKGTPVLRVTLDQALQRVRAGVGAASSGDVSVPSGEAFQP